MSTFKRSGIQRNFYPFHDVDLHGSNTITSANISGKFRQNSETILEETKFHSSLISLSWRFNHAISKFLIVFFFFFFFQQLRDAYSKETITRICKKKKSPPRARFRYQGEGPTFDHRFEETTISIDDESARSLVFLQRLRSPFCRKSVSRLKAVLPRAHFWYRAQGRGPSLARDTPFLLSAVVIAFRVHAPWIFRA